MIGRSFATEDAHDKIRAYIIDLFEVIECEAQEDLEEVQYRAGGENRPQHSRFFIHVFWSIP